MNRGVDKSVSQIDPDFEHDFEETASGVLCVLSVTTSHR